MEDNLTVKVLLLTGDTRRTHAQRHVGPYLVMEELGRGASGIVHRAIHDVIDREVAIKELRFAHLAPHEIPEARQRFIREARATAKLNHPSIVTLHDFIQEGDALYLVMEYVAGGSLLQLIRSERPPSVAAALQMVRQIASALDHAHDNDIVHRDIKPGNVLLSVGDVAKVTDFGIARIASESMTTTGVALGTPSYMAPEQIRGEHVDRMADQYSLGVVAYELLTYKRPFTAPNDNLAALTYQIVHGEPISPSRANPTLPVEVDQVIRKAIAKEPTDRFHNCMLFAETLAQALVPVEQPTRKTARPSTEPFAPRIISVGRTPLTIHDDGLKYVVIPPGSFTMGCSPGDTECYRDEKPNQIVTFTKGFTMGATVVTQAAYQRVTGKNPSLIKGEDLPVTNVSWDEAQLYCQSVGKRLPTEAEWEYAARAGTSGARYGPLDQIAWYNRNSGGKLHEVGGKLPNAWGLYDMLGNVWEWTSDSYDTSGKKVLRGGSWYNNTGLVRVSVRGRFGPAGHGSINGLRCVGELP